MTIVLITVTLFIPYWIVLGSLFIVVIGLVILAGIPILYCLKKLKSSAIMLMIMVVLQMLIAPHGNVIVKIGIVRVTDDAILYGLLVFVRLMIVIISTIVLTSTTKQKDFILSLESFLKPARKFGLKTGSIMLTFRIIQRFVPSIYHEAIKILNAQASRGLDIKGATIWMKVRLIGALLLPVFVVAIKRADDLSNSMAVRGYVINQKRTSYQTLQRDK
jgi:energy-coupling factor transport system permease protein